MHRPVTQIIIITAVAIGWLFGIWPLATALANASSYIGNMAALVVVIAAYIATHYGISSMSTEKESK